MHALIVYYIIFSLFYHCIGILYKKSYLWVKSIWTAAVKHSMSNDCYGYFRGFLTINCERQYEFECEKKFVCVMHYAILFSSFLSTDYMQIKILFCDFLRHIRVCGFRCRGLFGDWEWIVTENCLSRRVLVRNCGKLEGYVRINIEIDFLNAWLCIWITKGQNQQNSQ